MKRQQTPAGLGAVAGDAMARCYGVAHRTLMHVVDEVRAPRPCLPRPVLVDAVARLMALKARLGCSLARLEKAGMGPGIPAFVGEGGP